MMEFRDNITGYTQYDMQWLIGEFEKGIGVKNFRVVLISKNPYV